MKEAIFRVIYRSAFFLSFAFCGVCALAQTPPVASAPASTPNLQAEADRNYSEKSYALALDDYRRLLPTLPRTSPERTVASYRIAVALGLSQKWDDAFTAVDAFLAAHKDEPLWQARGLYQKGLLLNLAPHQGYKVGTHIYRGTDYPHTDSAEKPEQVSLDGADQKEAIGDFESALKLYGALPVAVRPAVAAEEADLCFDLAKLLPSVEYWGQPDDWKAAKTVDWSINASHSYGPSWPSPKKVLYLYARIPTLNSADSHRIVLSGLYKALYIARYASEWELNEYQPRLGKPGDKDYWAGGYRIVQTIPYIKIDPVVLLDKTADAYPNDPQTPQLRLIVAKWTENRHGYVKALHLYQTLLAAYPHCPWADDAAAGVQNILGKSITLTTSGPQHAEEAASLSVNSRNVKALTFHAYAVPLETALNDPKYLNNDELDAMDFQSVFGGPSGASDWGSQVAQWSSTVADQGDYAPVSASVKTPLTKTGAYVVEAESDDGKVWGATLVIISDLVVIWKRDKDNALVFVSDARSGQPVAGANVLVRQVYYNEIDPNTGRQKYRIVVNHALTDAEGVSITPLQGNNDSNLQRIEVFANAPGNRYALTNGWGNFWFYAANEDETKGYLYTDRSVYRPGQDVYFRSILAKPQSGGTDYTPLTDHEIAVTLMDAKAQVLYNKTLTTNEFGSIHGTLTLPKGAALGEYSVTVSRQVSNGDGSTYTQQCGSTTFRVEEYKKPEFIVRVTPSTTQARFGETVTAKISANYYFGNPVTRGKVAYKVFRNEYYPSYRFPEPYDWLYNSDRNGYYANQDAANGELVMQGVATTDSNGEAAIQFKAEKGSRSYQGDYAYTVMADVTDSSRRLISGEGILHVTNRQFYAYLNLPRSFAQEGDTVQVELRTQNADEKPVAATGTLTVYKLTYDEKTGDEISQSVHTQSMTTDADGKAFTTWKSEISGQYRLEFAAKDKYQADVKADTPVWVAGNDLDARSYRVGGITLLTDKTTYEQGETAHLLIVGDQPDNWVLLTQETDNQILRHDLVHMTGRATTVDVPIVRAHIPNFALAAVAMRDYKFYQWNQELFVPPSRQFISMAVTGNKAEYQPGETGVFHIKAADYQGHPVASEVSLAVTDTSVEYIQKDYAADIRAFYYGDRRNINVQADASQDVQYGSFEESDFPMQSLKPHGLVIPDTGRLANNAGYSDFYHLNQYGYFSRTDTMYTGATLIRRMDMATAYTVKSSNYRMSLASTSSSYQFPGLVSGVAGVPFDPSGGYVHLRGSDENAVGFGVGLKQARVRSNFADTAFWTPAVVTDPKDGTATIKVTFPDSLTTWKASARGATQTMLVGTDETNVVTTKHLLVRLESPRFFVERDQVTLSAIVMNTLKTVKQVRVSLATDASLLDAPDRVRSVTVPAGGEQRVDWTAHVKGAGTADITMTAETDEESDAVRQSFPVLEYGVQKYISGGGVLKESETNASFTVALPHERKAGSSALLVQVTPSLAATALDALPYLADYPYGCIEQTLSRFVPTVLVAHALRDAGVDLDTLHKRALVLQAREAQPSPFGQAAETTVDTDQTGYTYPHGTPGVLKTPMLAPELRSPYWYDNPVFDPDRLAAMEQDGLSRLTSMQRADGGFGWWPGSLDEDPYMTAYALYSLCAARDAGMSIPGDEIARAARYLENEIQRKDDEPNCAVWETFAISRAEPNSPPALHVAQAMYRQRAKLSPYGLALLALTLKAQARGDEAGILCRNLVDTARIDTENGTASWVAPKGYWWFWYYDDVETTAWVLQAMLAVDPKSDLTPMLVKWLVRHKQGNIWESTKATAMTISALMEYVRINHELDPDYTVTVALGNNISRTFKVNRDNALTGDKSFLVPDSLLSDGAQTVTVTKTGTGRCYFASSLQYFTTEEQIKGAGQELKVQRRYYRLTPKVAKRKDWGGDTYNALDYDRTELQDGADLKTGDMIEVELILDAKNDYAYVAFEDMKPAGCEPVDLRSGGRYGDGLCSDMELRDTKTAFFIDNLPQGTRVLRYRLRAEVPGAFHALPCNGYAMYAPDVRALSDSRHFTIEDAPTLAGNAS